MSWRAALTLVALLFVPILPLAQQAGGRGGGAQFPGGTNPDGSLRPSAPVTRLFTQDAYTEYALLEPGSDSFRIRFLPEETRVGATELVNATRGGSEGGDIQVFDPRTGAPLEFTYEQDPADPNSHSIRAKLPRPVPEGGIGRVLIYKTYKDPRTYMTNGDDLVWVRSLSGYRLGVILPKGYAFVSSNVAAHLANTPDGRLKLGFANPSGQANPVTIHARKTTAKFAGFDADRGSDPEIVNSGVSPDMFFDDVKTLYDLDEPKTRRVRVEVVYSDFSRGSEALLETRSRSQLLVNLPLQNLQVVDLDTAKVLTPRTGGGRTTVPLDVPITNDRQSAHLKVTGNLESAFDFLDDGTGAIVFSRIVYGLRNTVLLPAGFEFEIISQSATIGRYRGRAFAAFINLNRENAYRVMIRAKPAATGK